MISSQDHKKNCAFANCACGQCELIDTRRALDSHIKKGKKRLHNDDGENYHSSPIHTTPFLYLIYSLKDTNADFHIEAEMCASSMASSPTVSDGRTPSITDFEVRFTNLISHRFFDSRRILLASPL